MVKIYTGKGDDGSTSLWYGSRVPKDDGRTDAYGSLDEANSVLGVARSMCGDDAELAAADILRVQDELMIAGAELATAPRPPSASRTASAGSPDMAAELESLIDKYMGRVDLPPKFVLPGSTDRLGPARYRAPSFAAQSGGW